MTVPGHETCSGKYLGDRKTVENEKRVIGPVTKSAGVGAALGIIVGYVVAHYLLPGAPSEIQDAVSTVLMFIGLAIGGWIVKPRNGGDPE